MKKTLPLRVIPLFLFVCSCGPSSSGTDSGAMTGTDAGADSGTATGSDAGTDATATGSDSGPDGGTLSGPEMWSTPVSLVDSFARLAIGDQVHIVGHSGGNLVHRTSADDGANWGAPTIIAPAAGNVPAMYGGLFAEGSNVYLLTAENDMGPGPQQLDFRKSTDNGATWSPPVRITDPAKPIFRARIVASTNFVHVGGTADPTGDAEYCYFRSTDGGVTWDPGVTLAANLGPYGGGQTIAVSGSVVHGAYTETFNGVGGGTSWYLRSTDNGVTWSTPVVIGENSASSNRQARVQLSAAGSFVLATWQREADMTGNPVPADRLGYNVSSDGGANWATASILPYDTGIGRNHQQCWVTATGAIHMAWRHGLDAAGPDTDPAGYMFSPDSGATWEPSMLAIDAPGTNHPFNIVADATAVHLVTGPTNAMLYAYALLP